MITLCIALVFGDAPAYPSPKDYQCVQVTEDMANGVVTAAMWDPVVECVILPSPKHKLIRIIMHRLEKVEVSKDVRS